jgi:hypothetical protein
VVRSVKRLISAEPKSWITYAEASQVVISVSSCVTVLFPSF